MWREWVGVGGWVCDDEGASGGGWWTEPGWFWVVVVWEGRRCTGWFWVVFDRSQKGSGLGLNFGLGWAFGVTGQRIKLVLGFGFSLGPVRFRLILGTSFVISRKLRV